MGLSLKSGAQGSVAIDSFSPTMVDAFGRQRVSNPVTLFDSQQQYDKGRLYWEEKISGSASTAHLPNESSVELTVTANASDAVIRQTREYFRYQPGKSQEILMTADFGAPVSGVYKRYGYYDDENGVYWQQGADGVYSVGLRSFVTGSAVDTLVPQTGWNVDKMNGVGGSDNPSGLTLDGAKSQILIIDLQWLSVGTVRVGLEYNGILYHIHNFHHANIINGPYMTTANLPCRYEIGTDGTNGGTFQTICSSVISEGGFEMDRGIKFSATNGPSFISVTTRRPIMSFRPKATFNGITNRGIIIPNGMDFFSLNKACFFEIVYGGTLTGASFSSVNDDSITEFDVAATAITGGIVLKTKSTDKKAEAVSDVTNRFPLTLDINGAHPTAPYTDCFTLVATTLETATNVIMSAAWAELR